MLVSDFFDASVQKEKRRLMVKKILVTGGLGYIGSHVVVSLQNDGWDVVIIDDLSNSSLDVLQCITSITGKKPQFEKIDLRNKLSVMD